MVALGDYIGLILSELTIGRAQADVESVRIAEIYSTNKILKNFAVPRLRFENVEITMPVAIDKVEPAEIDARQNSPKNIRSKHCGNSDSYGNSREIQNNPS